MFSNDFSFEKNVKMFLKHTSYSYLSCGEGYWRNGDGRLIEIQDLGKQYRINCIKLVERDRQGLKSSGLGSNIRSIPDEVYKELNTDKATILEGYEIIYRAIDDLMEEKIRELKEYN